MERTVISFPVIGYHDETLFHVNHIHMHYIYEMMDPCFCDDHEYHYVIKIIKNMVSVMTMTKNIKKL